MRRLEGLWNSCLSIFHRKIKIVSAHKYAVAVLYTCIADAKICILGVEFEPNFRSTLRQL